MKTVVFAGPTVNCSDASRVLDAIYLPPAKQGDVRRLVSEGVDAIGIIDGQFHSVRSVWHKEILWALSEGIPVFGSASIGALRAAELHVFGMIGIGRIFEMFRDGLLEDDDEVAVIHAPAEQGYIPMSEAMVNIRATLAAAVHCNVLSKESAKALETSAKDLYFPYRNYRNLLEISQLECSELDRLGEWLPTGQIDQKRADANEMLETMRNKLSTGKFAPEVRYYFEHCRIFQRSSSKSPDDGQRTGKNHH
jgi:hypothetical protein